MERFYSIEHLSTEQLRDLFSSYHQQGWEDYEYCRLSPKGIKPNKLSNEEILSNMDAANKHNYFVYMFGHEDEQDGIMIGFDLTNYPLFGAYLHLDKGLLDEIVEKYGLIEKVTAANDPFLIARGDGIVN